MNIGLQRYILPSLVTFLLAYIHVGDAYPQDESVSDAGAPNKINRDRVLVRLNPKNVATDDSNQFQLEFELYRIQLSPEPGDIEYFENGNAAASGRQKIEKVLKNPVGIVFEEIHLRDVLDFMTKTYEINIIVDNRVVRLPGPKGPDKKLVNDESDYVTDGIIQYVNLKNVSLAEALRAILRPLGLDYSIQPSFIWISTPEKIASESFGFLYRPSSRFTFRQKGAYTFFDKETIVLGSPELTWSGKSQPARRDLSRLGSGKMILQEGQVAEIRVGDSTPIQYFEAQTVGDLTTYVLRTLDESIGFRAAFKVTSRAIPDEVDVEVSLSANIVGKRAPLDGVFLNVGEPQLTKMEHSGTHRVAVERWASLLGSADAGSALLLVFKVRSWSSVIGSSAGAAEHVSQTDIEEEVTQYVVEAKFLRYRGRLNKEGLKSMVEGSGAHRVALDTLRLHDGILPLRRKDLDFTDPKTLTRISKLRGFELMSAPRIAVHGTKAWARDTPMFKLVVINSRKVSNIEQTPRTLTPKDYQILFSTEQLTGTGIYEEIKSSWLSRTDIRDFSGIIVDFESHWLPRTDTRDVNRTTAELSRYYEAFTGVLLAVRVDDSSEEHPPMLDFYAQVRTKVDEEEGIAKRHDEAEATRSFFDFEDRVEFEEGEWLTYLVSLSEEEHYITLISVTRMSSKD